MFRLDVGGCQIVSWSEGCQGSLDFPTYPVSNNLPTSAALKFESSEIPSSQDDGTHRRLSLLAEVPLWESGVHSERLLYKAAMWSWLYVCVAVHCKHRLIWSAAVFRMSSLSKHLPR